MINNFCAINWCDWSGSDIIGLIISFLSILCTFFGAALGAYLGYRYASKVQQEEKMSDMKDFLNRLYCDLKKEIDSENIKDKILNNINTKVIELPSLEKAVQIDSLSTDLYIKLKDLQSKMNRINFWYSNKNEFWEEHSDNDYLVKAWDRLYDDENLTLNLPLADLALQESVPKEDSAIVATYIADCKGLWGDIIKLYELIVSQNVLSDIEKEKELLTLSKKFLK